MNRVEGMIATTRFGLGPAPGELKRVSTDPKGWLLEQIQADPAVPDTMRKLPPVSDNVTDWWEAVYQSVDELVRRIRREYRALWRREAKARLAEALATEQPFRERWVAFWSNHFTTSGRRASVIGMVGGYEREAIRPHVMATFQDLLLAAESHPAMLFYLDNYRSMGKNATVFYGQKGVNENLAREILELHTIGVNGGYQQSDVRALAKILTGWSAARPHYKTAGQFFFREDYHEPGPKVLLGQTYLENGVDEGKSALKWLAAQPATARHVATKLARHFIADEPPPAAVKKLTSVFLETQGDLKQLAIALMNLPEAWSPELHKLKTPQDYTVSALRALGGEADLDELITALMSFGHLPFMALSPAGWPDEKTAWLNPDSALRRARWSAAIAERYRTRVDPLAIANATIQPLAPARTMQAIASADSRAEGLALLLASPTFQRR